MSKITTFEQLDAAYTDSVIRAANAHITAVNGNNIVPIWQTREQCRIIDGEYTAMNIPGDDPLRFLHQSNDDPDKVAYTKDADHGIADVQTRTTMAAYCEKYGLVNPSRTVDEAPLSAVSSHETPVPTDAQLIAGKVGEYFAAKARVIELKKELQALCASVD